MHQTTADKAIVLKRQDFGEADRIVTFLTMENGKITGIVKGSRRAKSKMAGGIELFSISSITFLKGRSDMETIVSTRLEKHFGNIVRDVNKTMWAYEALKFLDKATEEATELAIFEIAANLMESLNDEAVPLEIVRLWFGVALLGELGHGINSKTDGEGNALDPASKFNFSYETMSFQAEPAGQYGVDHIKLLRLVSRHKPETIARVENVQKIANTLVPLVEQALRLSVH